MAFAYQQDTKTVSMPIYQGGQQASYAYDYTINFDSTQWQVVDYDISVTATQTYQPVIGSAQLVVTAQYGGVTETNTEHWDETNSQGTAQSTSVATTGGNQFLYKTSGSKLSIQMMYTLSGANLAFGPVSCNANVQMTVVFESITGTPTNYPSPTGTPTTTDNGNKSPSPFDFFKTPTGIVVAIAGGAVLLGLLRTPAGEASTTIITAGFDRASRAVRRRK